MLDSEFERQKRPYNNYTRCFIPKLLWPDTIYQDLHVSLERNLPLKEVSLGDFF